MTQRSPRMSERLSLREPSGANPAWLAIPLVVFALITLTVGLVARQTVREPYATPFFHPFFTDTLQMKAWLVTAAVVLACGQLLTAAPRVLIHSLLGSFLYGAVVAKVLIVRSTRFAPWVLPVAGGLLFSILLGLWLTSALWLFTAAPSAT